MGGPLFYDFILKYNIFPALKWVYRITHPAIHNNQQKAHGEEFLIATLSNINGDTIQNSKFISTTHLKTFFLQKTFTEPNTTRNSLIENSTFSYIDCASPVRTTRNKPSLVGQSTTRKIALYNSPIQNTDQAPRVHLLQNKFMPVTQITISNSNSFNPCILNTIRASRVHLHSNTNPDIAQITGTNYSVMKKVNYYPIPRRKTMNLRLSLLQTHYFF